MKLLIKLLVSAWLCAVGLQAHAQASAPLPDFTDLVDRASPAVVNVRTASRATPGQAMPQIPGLEEGDPFYDFFRRFFPQPSPQPRQGPQPRSPHGGRELPRGLGSGFIISADGYVMTNHHVVEGADEIIVTLPDRREFRAKLVGSDQRTDVALLKIAATGLPTVRIGSSASLRVGEWVIAIGSPFGLDSTVTAGIVSAKARETGDFLPLIQTDAAVNPGNSGGPLINLRGEVVGINSQIFTTSGSYAGISFAIPIDEAMRTQEQLRTQGRVIRGRIGVTISEVTRDVADGIGLAKPQGALVTNVERDGPAEKAGVEAGDVILRFDGKTIDRSSELPRVVGATKPGARVTMSVWRKGKSVDLQVTVAELQSDSRQAQRSEQQRQPAPVTNPLGLAVSDVPPDRLKELRVHGAVQVDGVDGPAAAAGIQVGDLILSINNVDVKSAKQFNEIVTKLDVKRNIAVLVRRGDQAQFLIVRPANR
jgi:serine protease Do